MYKLLPILQQTGNTKNDVSVVGTHTDSVFRTDNNSFIPFSTDNRDYKNFKIDLTNGAQLQDANSNVMTAEQVTAFLNTLP